MSTWEMIRSERASLVEQRSGNNKVAQDRSSVQPPGLSMVAGRAYILAIASIALTSVVRLRS